MEINEARQPLLLERIASWLFSKIQENKVPILTSTIVAILTYTFAFTNKLINHDDVTSLFSKGSTSGIGRWGLDLLSYILPDYSMPWLYGVMTIVLITAGICVIIHTFSIRSKLLQALLAGIIIAFPSLVGTFSYMFTSSSYGISFLLAVLAVWLLQKDPRKGFLPALVCCVAAVSIYQAYISITASLMIVLLVQQMLHEETIQPVFRKGVFYLLFLATSLIVYFILTLLVYRIKGIGVSDYATESLNTDTSSIPMGLVYAYGVFVLFFAINYYSLIPTPLSSILHILCLVAVTVLLVLWFKSRKPRKKGYYLFLVALIALLPLAINCMYLISPPSAVHTLVLYSFISVYVLAAIVVDACLPLLLPNPKSEKARRMAVNVVSVGMTIAIICNIYIANEAYLKMYQRYENAYAFYSTLVADLKMMPEFDEDTKIAIIGEYQNPEFYNEHYSHINITGTNGFLPDHYSKADFLEYYLGVSIPFATDEEIAQITATSEYAEMATYPYYGSMQMIGDTLVVKLS